MTPNEGDEEGKKKESGAASYGHSQILNTKAQQGKNRRR